MGILSVSDMHWCGRGRRALPSQNFREWATAVLVPVHSIGRIVSICLIVITECTFQSLWS